MTMVLMRSFSARRACPMHLSELSTGYGKFQYTREGVNHARGIYPRNIAGCAITSLNSPSDSEISLSPSLSHASLTSSFTSDETVVHYGQYLLGFLLVPPSIGFVACSVLEHPVADPGDVAGNSVPCVVFGYSLGQEMIVILPDRIVSMDRGQSSSLARFAELARRVHRLEDSTVAWFAPTVAASATELLVSDQSTVTQVFAARRESSCIHDTGNDLHCSNRTDAIELRLETHQCILPSPVRESDARTAPWCAGRARYSP